MFTQKAKENAEWDNEMNTSHYSNEQLSTNVFAQYWVFPVWGPFLATCGDQLALRDLNIVLWGEMPLVGWV